MQAIGTLAIRVPRHSLDINWH